MFNFRRPSVTRAVVLLCAGLLAGTWGCRTASGPCPAVKLEITPNPTTLVQSRTRQFTATATDYKGNVVSTSASWAVVASGGTINASSGLFTAGTVNGLYSNTIEATCSGLTAHATVTVVSVSPVGALATITVTPNPATVVVTGTRQFVATGRDGDGNVVAITPTWSVVASGGDINSSGNFTAGSVTGTFTNTVRATSGAISGYATVIVTSVAGTFNILGGSTVTNTGVTTTIEGDVGVSPGTAITGLPAGQPTAGSIYAGDATAATAQTALTTAYNDLAGRACGTNLTSADLGGMTLAPGVYCFNTSAGLTGTLTLDGQGNSAAVFVIQIGSTLTTASSSAVNLIGGAVAGNVFWQIGSSATLGTGTAFSGNIVALQSITLNTGASLVGRALARNGAVTLDTNAVTLP
jgi:hypothetical protein